jgi:hypothetical protein
MGEAVGVDRNALELVDLPLAQGAFDGGARLPAVEDDRLIIEDAPLVEYMSIGADRISACRIAPVGGDIGVFSLRGMSASECWPCIR